jgi:hypothetical protein
MRAVLAFWVCGLCVGSTTPSYAWGENGHRIVALIAQEELTPSAKAAIADLLSVETDARVHSFDDAAVWPDLIKGERPETKPWHFVDIELAHTDYNPARDCTEAGPGDCLIPRIESFAAILKDKTKPLSDRLEALKFVEHLVGDLHQPLHCADNMDRGGNDVVVKWFGKSTNLHAVWDSSIIDMAGETPDIFSEELINKINALTAGQRAKIQSGTLNEWVLVSHALARTHAYKIATNHLLGRAYYNANVDTVDTQLINGGLRLARILNDSLR